MRRIYRPIHRAGGSFRFTPLAILDPKLTELRTRCVSIRFSSCAIYR
ncbi:MAG: hypothetical protein M3Q73_00765 [bacterium]|nr:hypothetical protein [bacterium]